MSAHVHVYMCVHAWCVHASECIEYLTLGGFWFKNQGPNLSFQVQTHVCTERQCREDTFLLCIAMDTMFDKPFSTEGCCKFTSALRELRPTPESWTTFKGHQWEQGTPNQDVWELVEQAQHGNLLKGFAT